MGDRHTTAPPALAANHTAVVRPQTTPQPGDDHTAGHAEDVPPAERALALGRLASASDALVRGRDANALHHLRAALALIEGGLPAPARLAELDRIRTHVDPDTAALFEQLLEDRQ